jgi:hypothetical protein
VVSRTYLTSCVMSCIAKKKSYIAKF